MTPRTARRSAPTTSAACCVPRLLQAREDFADGRIYADELRAVEDEAIREVVKLQEDAGSSRSPTASSAAPPGTWTSSTSSAASPRPRAT